MILDFLTTNTSALLGAMNFMLFVVGMVAGTVYLFRFLVGGLEGYARTISLGIAATAFGLGFQRLYWTIQRFTEKVDHSLGHALYSEWSWITLLPLSLVILGYTFHLSPFLKPAFGKYWLIHYTGMLLILYASFFILFGSVIP